MAEEKSDRQAALKVLGLADDAYTTNESATLYARAAQVHALLAISERIAELGNAVMSVAGVMERERKQRYG